MQVEPRGAGTGPMPEGGALDGVLEWYPSCSTPPRPPPSPKKNKIEGQILYKEPLDIFEVPV